MNVKFFNGSVEDTFDFVLTTLTAEKKKTDEIEPDSDFFLISIKTTSKLTRDTIRLQINFLNLERNKNQCAIEFTRVMGDGIEFMKKVKYYKKRLKKVLKALIKKHARQKYE